MNDQVLKNKIKLAGIIDEISSLKKYTSELSSNSSSDKIDNYLNKLNSDILKAQEKVETININNE